MVTESDKADGKPYVREEDQYRLERPGVLAMREYVPGASFFVGNKIITSHGLLKHWTGTNLNTAIGFRGQMAECVNGHRFYSFNADLGRSWIDCRKYNGKHDLRRQMLTARQVTTSPSSTSRNSATPISPWPRRSPMRFVSRGLNC